MKKSILFILLIISTLSLDAQKDTLSLSGSSIHRDALRDPSTISITIFPVPVRENNFTVKTDKDVTFLKVTNIIGQDIYRRQFNDPLQLITVQLENPKRGMYLVTMIFSDGLRVVKKIMIEESE
jgi:hypothetical protein